MRIKFNILNVRIEIISYRKSKAKNVLLKKIYRYLITGNVSWRWFYQYRADGITSGPTSRTCARSIKMALVSVDKDFFVLNLKLSLS